MPEEGQEVSAEGEPQGRGGGGGGLSTKWGPLPIWGWGLAFAGILGVFWYTKHRSSSATTTVGSQGTSGGAPPGDNSAGLGVTNPNDPNIAAILKLLSDQSSRPPAPDPNGATLSALLTAMQAQAGLLSGLIGKLGNSQPAPASSPSNFVGPVSGAVVAPTGREALQGWSNLGVDISGAAKAPYYSQTVPDEKNKTGTQYAGQVPFIPWAGIGGVGGPRFLGPPTRRRIHGSKSKGLAGILNEILSGGVFATDYSSSHSEGGGDTARTSSAPRWLNPISSISDAQPSELITRALGWSPPAPTIDQGVSTFPTYSGRVSAPTLFQGESSPAPQPTPVISFAGIAQPK